MERLTDCAQGYCELYCKSYGLCRMDPEICARKNEAALYAKLKDYEITGLEPKEIERILDAYGRGMTLRQANSERLQLIHGISTDRLRELAQADMEGRLVVLPCKVGDTVYWLGYNRDACGSCDCYSSFYGMDSMCDEHYELYPEVDPVDDDKHCPKHFIEIIERKTTLQWIFNYLNKFGETVFLTEEEAERELEGGRPDGNM